MRFATALAAVAVVAFGVTAGVARQDPIAARTAQMKANGQNAGVVSKMVKGEQRFDAAKVQAAFTQWAETAQKLPTFPPENSKIGDLDGSRQIRVRPNARVSGQISPSSAVRAARGDGNISDLASVLQEVRQNANTQASLKVIWGILVYRG